MTISPMKGFWLLSSRRRPASLKRFFAAAVAAKMSTPGYVLIDQQDYDDNKAEYEAMERPEHWGVFISKGETQGAKFTEIWPIVKNADWLGHLGDDHVPMTENWDTKLIERLTGWNFLDTGDDWITHILSDFMTGGCIFSGELCRTVGWFYPPGLNHAYNDNIWGDIGRRAKCWHRAMDIVISHDDKRRHGVIDETNRRAYEVMPEDESTYRMWCRNEMGDTVTRVMNLMQSHGVEVRHIDLTGKIIYIATPSMTGEYCGEYVNALINTIQMIRQCGGDADWGRIEHSPDLCLSRAKMIGSFLRNKSCTHMMMIDDDMGWDPIDVIRLIGAGKDFVGAAGPKKIGGGPQFAFTSMRGAGTDSNGLMQVQEVGGAFLLLTRDACTRMVQQYRDLGFGDGSHFQPEVALFDPIIVDGRYGRQRKFEDYAFCHRWRQIGGEIFIDVNIRLKHKGSHTWRGATVDIMGLPPVPFARELRDGVAPVPGEPVADAAD